MSLCPELSIEVKVITLMNQLVGFFLLVLDFFVGFVFVFFL